MVAILTRLMTIARNYRAMVSGRNDIPYSRRVQIDLYYVNAHNFIDQGDCKTIGVVIVPKDNGAY